MIDSGMEHMELWSMWPQREHSVDAKRDKHWFSKSFLFQMAQIDSEMERIFRNNTKLERIRANRDYVGEPQVIQHIFEWIKRDPKNVALLREIQSAEWETAAFLVGAPNAPALDEIRAYWNGYTQSYMAELEQRDVLNTKEAER